MAQEGFAKINSHFSKITLTDISLYKASNFSRGKNFVMIITYK